MNRKERDFITLRFRKQLDNDLKEAVKNLESGELSELVRDGLRLMLGIRTTRKVHVMESVLVVPASMYEANKEKEGQADPQRRIRLPGKPLLNVGQKKDGMD